MFDRFTDDARKGLGLARQAAQRLCHDHIGTAHVALGLLQLDCPDLALARHVIFSDLSDDDFVKAADRHVEVLNHALRHIPRDRIRVHICWGNYEGPHLCDIAMDKVFSTLMRTKSRYVLFETSNPRHAHEWTFFATARRRSRTTRSWSQAWSTRPPISSSTRSSSQSA